MSKSIYESITANIITELEKGAAPWVKPWHADSSADKNILSQKPYQGINRLILGMSGMSKGFTNPAWGSFKQWQGLGANVRKGEKGTQVIFYSPGQRENDKGEKEMYAILKFSWVFNVQQVDGIELTNSSPVDKPFTQHEVAEQRIIKTGAAISHGGDAAFYMPSQDRIQLPNKSAFTSECNYYATAMHELIHWSGAKHRLDRELKGRFASPDYAFEELVAELGASFLCQDLGIQGDLRHAGYIQSWLKACRDDSRAIFKASALAQKAADYVNGLDATAVAIAA
jgi:antirestriction protein ArdC